jgi:hypothetical protein
MATTVRSRLATFMAAFAAVALTVGGLGCGGSQKLTPPPPPLRPKATPVAKPETAAPITPGDCPTPDPSKAIKSKSYTERSPAESEKLAREGLVSLQNAESPSVDKVAREDLITKAVDSFIEALLADPYNVTATYNLAAAYARVDRKQCAVNMLTRLIQMKPHVSRKTEVEKKLDRLLGRNGQSLDPDFREMRSDDRFRNLISTMCQDAPDPSACVTGASGK